MSKSSIDHPFGREDEVSSEQLFTFFCSNLYLGQWELARACIPLLHKQKSALHAADVEHVLEDVVRNPYGYSVGSDSVSTVHHLSSLCLQELCTLRPVTCGQDDFGAMQDDVNFRLLLVDSCQEDNSDVTQEFYIHHSSGSSRHPQHHTESRVLSTDCEQFLGRLLLEHPSKGCALLHSMVSANTPCNNVSDDQLLLCHLTSLTLMLHQLKVSESEKSPFDEDLRKFYSLLAGFDPSACQLAGGIPVDEFLQEIIEILHHKSAFLHWDRVYSALLGRNGSHLVELFNCIHCRYTFNLYKSEECRKVGVFLDDKLTDFQKCIVGLSRNAARDEAWKDMFTVCWMERRHFLDSILDTMLSLVESTDWERLKALLAPDEFAPLRPLALLVACDHCSTLDDVHKLLQTICSHQPPSPCRATLVSECDRLKRQVTLAQWCRHNVRSLSESSEDSVKIDELYFFQGLEQHSVLHMLNQCTRLSSLNSDRVLQFLQTRPSLYSSDGSDLKKTVRFSLEDTTTLDSSTQPIGGLEQEVDAATYQGFCAIKYVMDTISFAAESTNWDDTSETFVAYSRMMSLDGSSDANVDMSQFKNISSVELIKRSEDTYTSLSSSVSEFCSSPLDMLQGIYEQNIVRKLQMAAEYVRRIYPLAFRIEILENLFSLLFVTHQDVAETSEPSDSGEQGSDGGTQEGLGYPGVPTPTTPRSPTTNGTGGTLKCFRSELKRRALFVQVPGGVADQDMACFQSNKSSESGGIDENHDTFEPVPQIRILSEAQDKMKEGSPTLEVKSGKSGNCSVNSGASSGGSKQIGFLVHEYVVRDLLLTLRDSLVDLSACRYSLLGQGYTSESANGDARHLQDLLEGAMITSVENTQLTQRISRLTQYVSEALWRFQLVSPDWMTQQFGKIDDEWRKNGEDGSSADDDDVGGCGSTVADSHRKRRTTPSISTTGTTDSESRHSTDGGVSNDTPVTQRPRRRHKRGSLSHGLQQTRQGIIPKMLSPQSALLTLCLRRGKLEQAEQVVKMFDLEDNTAAEMTFAKVYSSAVKKIQQEDSRIHYPTANSKVKAKGLGAIASAAAAAVASMGATATVDQVLALSNLPNFGIDMTPELRQVAPQLSAQIAEENLPGMIVLDLACGASQSWQSAIDLLDMAKKRLPPEGATHERQGSPAPRMLGAPGFLCNLFSLLNLGNTQTPSSSRFFKKSANLALRTGTQPLDAAQLKSYVTTVAHLESTVNRLLGVIADSKRRNSLMFLDDEALMTLPQGARTGQRRPALTLALKELIAVCHQILPAEGVTAFLRRPMSQTDVTGVDYLQSMYDHMKGLTALVTEWEGQTQESENSEFFHVMQRGPTEILGRLMFVHSVPPMRLEEVAERMHINLTKVIVNSCCPLIPCHRLGQAYDSTDPYIRVHGSKVVLNHSDSRIDSTRHPVSVVTEILSGLVQLMREEVGSGGQGVFGMEAARTLMVTGTYQSLIHSTRLLKYIDLKQLTSHDEKLCFYGNLLTLMMIHARLYEVERKSASQSHDCELFNDWTTTSLESVLMQRKVAYWIGQLGLVSLYDLRYVITRSGLRSPQCHSRLVEALQYDLDASDPWSAYCPCPDPRLSFVVSDGVVSSPILQVLSPDDLETQMESTVKKYLEATIRVKVDHNQIILPELLYGYAADFVNRDEVDFLSFAGCEDILRYVLAHADGNLFSQLEKLLERNQHSVDASGKKAHGSLPAFKCTVAQLGTECGYTLDYTTLARLYDVPPLLAHQGRQRSETVSSTGAATYCLTPVTLEYLDNRLSLMATLASVTCKEVDEIQQSCLDRHFPDHTPHEVDDIKKESIRDADSVRQFRSKKLASYATLNRHLSMQILGGLLAENEAGSSHMTTNSEDVKSAILSPMVSPKTEVAVIALVAEMLKQQQWTDVIQVLQSSPPVNAFEAVHWMNLKDVALCCCVIKNNENWRLLLQISDVASRARVVLSSLKRWSVDVSVELLKACRCNPVPLGEELALLVEEKLKELTVYQQVIECVRILQDKEVTEEEDGFHDNEAIIKGTTLQQLTCWTDVMQQSHDAPGLVLDVLLQCKRIGTANQWADLHHVTDNLRMQIQQAHLVDLLERSDRDFTHIFQILEREKAADAKTCLRLCDNILPKLTRTQNILVVADFMQRHLEAFMSDDQWCHLWTLCAGCRAVHLVPETWRSFYDHLAAAPLLLVEQLLMNMKVEWAGRVLVSLRKDLAVTDHSSLPLSGHSFDELLVSYATNALEFSVVQTEVPVVPTLIRSKSRTSLASFVQKVSKLVSSDLPSGGQDGLNYLSRSASVMAPHRAPGSPMQEVAGSLPVTPRSLTRKGSSSSLQGGATRGFVMPPEPPSKDQWVPDSATAVCMLCQLERFTMLNRRHHCRRCGRVVCATCSRRTTVIRGLSVRTCDDCYMQTFKPKGTLEEQAVMRTLHEKLSGVSRTPGDSPQIHFQIGSGASHTSPLASPPQGFSSEYRHQLSFDDDFNATVRDEFYYEHAPSTSLCLSILELHSDPGRCGEVILDLCDEVSKLLRPIAPGVKNPEVDYGLVISMLKNLLFNAKVCFLRAEQNARLSLCELYLDRVNLLDLLVANDCNYIPSIQQLTKNDYLGRLRDKLIEDERLKLAMDVSTKCGLDPSGVWGAWGLTCIKQGDYAGAREKFSRCLKTLLDKNQTQSCPKLLRHVLEMLQSAPAPGGGQMALLASLGSVKDLLAEPAPRAKGDTCLLEPQMQECLFYLTTYGSHMTTLEFFCAHDCLKRATEYILEKKCSAEVFLEGLLLPSLTSGEMTWLQEHMLTLDPTLDCWSDYLTAACRHFSKTRLIHVLYQFQIFMKDFMRAAMTCISYFYQKGASDYPTLSLRLPHLANAKHHLEAYLDNRQWEDHPTPLRHPSWGSLAPPAATGSFRMIMTPGEVTKYIHTIELQVEVTKFLAHYHHNQLTMADHGQAGAASSPLTYQSSQAAAKPPTLPTLFGSTRMKAEVSSLIMLCGNNVNDGFGLAFRIIQDFKLEPTYIYSQVGRQCSLERRYGSVHQLMGCVRDSGLCTDHCFDEVVGACIHAIADQPAEAKEMENLIRLLRLDANKINAYILCGRLKSAYLIAVKGKRVDDVQRVSQAADRLGQTAVKAICDKWLQPHRR